MVPDGLTQPCLHTGCEQTPVDGAQWGFTFCRTHMTIAQFIVPVPADFTPVDGVEPVRLAPRRPSEDGLGHYPQAEQDRDEIIRLLKKYPALRTSFFVHEYGVSRATVCRIRTELIDQGIIPRYGRHETIPHPPEEEDMKFTPVDMVPATRGSAISKETKEIAEHCTRHPGASFQLDPTEALGEDAMESDHAFRVAANHMRDSLKRYAKSGCLPHPFTVNMNAAKRLLYVTYAMKEKAA